MHFSSIWCKEHTIEKSFESKYFLASLLIYSFIILILHKGYISHVVFIFNGNIESYMIIPLHHRQKWVTKMACCITWKRIFPVYDVRNSLQKTNIEILKKTFNWKGIKSAYSRGSNFQIPTDHLSFPQVDNISSSSSSSNDNWIAYKP